MCGCKTPPAVRLAFRLFHRLILHADAAARAAATAAGGSADGGGVLLVGTAEAAALERDGPLVTKWSIMGKWSCEFQTAGVRLRRKPLYEAGGRESRE